MTLDVTLAGLYREISLLLVDSDTGKISTIDDLNEKKKASAQIYVSAIDLLSNSERHYTRLFDSLKCNWALNCEHDDKLTDKIERCEAALTTLHNLGFNLVTGEVEK